MDWILQRAKAFAATLAVAVVMAIIKSFESSFGLDIPAGFETIALDFVKHMISPDTVAAAVATGIVVHQTPNKPA